MALLRTTALLGLLTGLLLAVGFLFAGTAGMTIAFVMALAINFFSYWYSDKIVLAIYGAKPSDNKTLNDIVSRVAKRAEIPKPKVYIVENGTANAFATGRDPKHAAVAATRGILDALTEDELEGVLAHEISHVKNRDTLVSTIAATIGGAIAFLANMAWYSLFFSRSRGGNAILIPMIILAPLAAMLVRTAISRGRESHADYTGAMITRRPLALASALEKISSISSHHPMRGNAATSHLWIVNPFKADTFVKLFSTHPSTEKRVAALKKLAKEMKA